MVIITEEQIKKLRPYIKNLDELLAKEDDEELLLELDSVIVDNIITNNDEPDAEGKKLQLIYDQIFYQNDWRPGCANAVIEYKFSLSISDDY